MFQCATNKNNEQLTLWSDWTHFQLNLQPCLGLLFALSWKPVTGNASKNLKNRMLSLFHMIFISPTLSWFSLESQRPIQILWSYFQRRLHYLSIHLDGVFFVIQKPASFSKPKQEDGLITTTNTPVYFEYLVLWDQANNEVV